MNGTPRWSDGGKDVYTILGNLVFNECRRRSRHPARSLEAVQEEGEMPQQFEDSSVKAPNTVLLDREMQEAVARAIEELLPAVKSVLFRARTELGEKLKRYLDE